MNTCQTCKHWELQSDAHGPLGECHAILHVDNTIDVRGVPLAFVKPGEYCGISFMTGGDFGCVKFEAKEQ